MNLWVSTFAAPAILSFVLLLWQWLAARKFPLHQRVAKHDFSPPISILKPLKGCDDTTAASLRSWFLQNYNAKVQILFGVADAADPVCAIVRQLIAENPAHDAQLVVCTESLGSNAKVSTLIQLKKFAKHDLFLVSDADVRVPPDFLENIVVPLRDEKNGLVNCFYRLANPVTTAMRWEAVAINADFWSHVLQSASFMPLDFALGAVMLTRRDQLEQIGGFRALADYLADDYQIGNRIARSGHRIALCPVVVECWDAPLDWGGVWRHQLRWGRTIRACQPLPYFFSILSNATFWPLLWLLVSIAVTANIFIPLAVIIFLAVRIALARNLQCRLLQSCYNIAPAWLVPVKDLLQVAVWIGAFASNKVEWRGQMIHLRRDGTLKNGGR